MVTSKTALLVSWRNNGFSCRKFFRSVSFRDGWGLIGPTGLTSCNFFRGYLKSKFYMPTRNEIQILNCKWNSDASVKLPNDPHGRWTSLKNLSKETLSCRLSMPGHLTNIIFHVKGIHIVYMYVILLQKEAFFFSKLYAVFNLGHPLLIRFVFL